MRTRLNRYDDVPAKQSLHQSKDDGAQVTIDKKEGNEENELTWRFDPNLPQPLYYETRTDKDDAMRTVLNRYDDHPNPSLVKKGEPGKVMNSAAQKESHSSMSSNE